MHSTPLQPSLQFQNLPTQDLGAQLQISQSYVELFVIDVIGLILILMAHTVTSPAAPHFVMRVGAHTVASSAAPHFALRVGIRTVVNTVSCSSKLVFAYHFAEYTLQVGLAWDVVRTKSIFVQKMTR